MSAFRAGLGAALFLAGMTGLSFAQETSGTGIIVGQVALPEDLSGGDLVQAVLMPPEWASNWNVEVQQRIDAYFANNSNAIDRDRDLFDLIARRARREATTSVMSRMRQRLGEDFGDAVREVDADGSFEFVNVPFGDYRIIVIADIGEEGRIWPSGVVSIRSPIPEFVEIRDRIE